MIAERILPEFDNEMKVSRSVLERVDWTKKDWKPHPKSMSFGVLAGHVAEAATWSLSTLKGSGIDMAATPYVAPNFDSIEDLLKDFDLKLAKARKQIEQTSDETFMENWTLRAGEVVYFSMPKIAVHRGFVMNHMIHHRGQLSVYLRLNDIPVPSIYGPSADTAV